MGNSPYTFDKYEARAKFAVDSCSIFLGGSMYRPLRIQYPDAWYHVMNRGGRGEKIFATKEDYWSFVDLLEELDEVFVDFCVLI